MKRIHANHDNKDRVLCITDIGKHTFYYRPVYTNQWIWLFSTKTCSVSISTFFHKYGRSDGLGFSLTLKELYRIKTSCNHKVSKVIERLPDQIEYVLRENEDECTA